MKPLTLHDELELKIEDLIRLNTEAKQSMGWIKNAASQTKTVAKQVKTI